MRRASEGGSRQGNILVGVVLVAFAFLTAFGLFAGGQILHARSLNADYGKLQARYAAEAGIYAVLRAQGAVASTVLWSDGSGSASYEGTTADSAPGQMLTGTGTANVRGDTFTASARAYVLDGRIIYWEFLP